MRVNGVKTRDFTLKDWAEDFVLENGNYLNTCSVCESEFMGHKMRRECRSCSNIRNYSLREGSKTTG